MYPELIKLMAITGMKHKDLAKLLEISQQAISKKLKGDTDFKMHEMRVIKNYFKNVIPDITMDKIFEENIFLPQ